MSLKEDYKYCEEIIKVNSKSFYSAFKILPEQKRNSVYAIYAFCRLADDSVDILNSKDKLADLENSLNSLVEKHPQSTPVFRALKDTFEVYKLDSYPFYDMIEGQKSDFNFKQPENLEEFKDYCYFVAGTVGLMLLPIIATNNRRQLVSVAKSLGEAMQITNILRDVGEDYDLGRIYIPKNLLDNYPTAFKAISEKKVNNDFIGCWEELAHLAEENYSYFFENLELFDSDSIKAVARSALYYGEILDVIRKNDYDCLSKRQYVSSFDYLNVRLKSLLSGGDVLGKR